MSIDVRVALSEVEWREALAMLHGVYVGEGYSTADRAAIFQQRRSLEPEGELLIATREGGRVLGATLFLREGSSLHQIARSGEREFRMLAVRREARGTGVGQALVQACIQRAVTSDAAGLVLRTQPSMHAAHRLYERVGFLRAPERDQDDPRGFKRLVYTIAMRSFC